MHAERTRAGAVVVAGPPASGKTTLGAALARALHHAFIDLDIVTGTMTRAALSLAGADETALDHELGARLRDARYGALLDTAAANLGVGLGVVLSGPFTRERSDATGAGWGAVRERLGDPNAALICLRLDETTRRSRMLARDAARDRTKLTTAAATPEPTGPLPAGAIELDGGARLDALLDAALAALGKPTAGSVLHPCGHEPSPPPRHRC